MQVTLLMRRLASGAALFALLTGFVRAQEQASTADSDWAEAMFSERSHDFGSVARGADVRHQIAIKNLYKETIHITSVTTTCGCTVAERSQKELATGETAYVEVVMNTVKFLREKTSNVDVTVTFDGRTHRTVRIPIKAYIRPDVVLEPGRAEFGSVEVGQGAERRIQIAYAGRDDWRITDVRSPSSRIATRLEETGRGGGRVNYDLVVSLSPDTPIGAIHEQVVLMTDDERSPEVDILVEGQVVADIVVNPTRLELGEMTPGVAKTMSVVVRGRHPFAIDKIECDSERDCFKVRLGKDLRNVHVIPLTVTPPSESGTFTETFYLTIAGREEAVTFTATGTVSPAQGQ